MKLCIISHTEHYENADGTLVGWGPTITEINHLTAVFDAIYHVAMLHPGTPPPSALPYTSPKIHFVALPPLGGRTLQAKLNSVFAAPQVLKTVAKTLKKVDVFQLRTPTGIGVYLIPYLSLCVKKQGWYKYAGNWNQSNPPLGYRLQRWMLKQQSRKVTINGSWPNQPRHCLTFENPCLTETDLQDGLNHVQNKDYKLPFTFCYVGRLESEKGVGRIIQAFSQFSDTEKALVKTVHLVGDGPERADFERRAKASGIHIQFHGYLPREQVFEIFKQSDVFLMPTTASEGFPKVIAEAMNFGCFPVVSNVSAIEQYVKHNKIGLVLGSVSSEDLKEVLMTLLNRPIANIYIMSNETKELIQKFTFLYYNNMIIDKIIKKV